MESYSLFIASFQNIESGEDIASSNVIGSSSTKYVRKSGPKEVVVLGLLLLLTSASSNSIGSSLTLGGTLRELLG